MKLDMLHHCYILWRVECGEMFFKGALQLTMSITQKLFQREKKKYMAVWPPGRALPQLICGVVLPTK